MIGNDRKRKISFVPALRPPPIPNSRYKAAYTGHLPKRRHNFSPLTRPYLAQRINLPLQFRNLSPHFQRELRRVGFGDRDGKREVLEEFFLVMRVKKRGV